MSRINQFMLCIFSKISDDDIVFISKYLDTYEKDLFLKLSESEQTHSVRVARLIIIRIKESSEYANINIDRIVKAGLLHDIGKSYKKINVFEKVLMVLGNKIFGQKIKKLCSINFIDSYYNHGNMSYNMLKNHVKDEKFLFLIKNHHSEIQGNIELDLLKYCDDKN